jgi:hypothetical protein
VMNFVFQYKKIPDSCHDLGESRGISRGLCKDSYLCFLRRNCHGYSAHAEVGLELMVMVAVDAGMEFLAFDCFADRFGQAQKIIAGQS